MLPQIADQGSQATDGTALATVTVDNARAELSLIDSAWTTLDSATSTTRWPRPPRLLTLPPDHLLRNWPADVFLFMYPSTDVRCSLRSALSYSTQSDGLAVAKTIWMGFREMFPTDQVRVVFASVQLHCLSLTRTVGVCTGRRGQEAQVGQGRQGMGAAESGQFL